MTDELNIDYQDFPLMDVAAKAEEMVSKGAIVFQKFTCEQCHNRLTIDEQNKFYTRGQCDQCGHTTDLRERGCNYLLVWPLTPEGEKAIETAFGG